MKILLLITLIAMVVLTTTVAAVPPLPAEFSGGVTIDGVSAPVGTLIVAKIGDQVRGNYTTTAPGSYGGTGSFEAKLIVSGPEEEANKEVTFWVGTIQAIQTSKFVPGGVETLNLVFVISGAVGQTVTTTVATQVTTYPTYSSSGGGGGGGGSGYSGGYDSVATSATPTKTVTQAVTTTSPTSISPTFTSPGETVPPNGTPVYVTHPMGTEVPVTESSLVPTEPVPTTKKADLPFAGISAAALLIIGALYAYRKV
ncbi:MAG: hypothetical protein NT074_03805 [Methanomicrobiales archaeon]|nr:hypothetical protein [Methanomicrobiales archaeon]